MGGSLIAVKLGTVVAENMQKAFCVKQILLRLFFRLCSIEMPGVIRSPHFPFNYIERCITVI